MFSTRSRTAIATLAATIAAVAAPAAAQAEIVGSSPSTTRGMLVPPATTTTAVPLKAVSNGKGLSDAECQKLAGKIEQDEKELAEAKAKKSQTGIEAAYDQLVEDLKDFSFDCKWVPLFNDGSSPGTAPVKPIVGLAEGTTAPSYSPPTAAASQLALP